LVFRYFYQHSFLHKTRSALLFQFTLERLDHSVAELPGRHLGPDLCIVVLRIVIAPLVAFIPAVTKLYSQML
jgi:hypothetical protein